LREIPIGTKDIFESFRVKILQKGFPEPEKDTWWGNLASKAIAQGVLQMTKEVGHMRLPKSNGRRSPVYVRICDFCDVKLTIPICPRCGNPNADRKKARETPAAILKEQS
jgi:hypothetical protein